MLRPKFEHNLNLKFPYLFNTRSDCNVIKRPVLAEIKFSLFVLLKIEKPCTKSHCLEKNRYATQILKERSFGYLISINRHSDQMIVVWFCSTRKINFP